MEKGRRWKRRHQEARLPTKKPKSHQSYHRKNLSTEQVKYREQVASQLQDGENIDCIPPQAFVHQDGWEERKTLAAEYAEKCVLEDSEYSHVYYRNKVF